MQLQQNAQPQMANTMSRMLILLMQPLHSTPCYQQRVNTRGSGSSMGGGGMHPHTKYYYSWCTTYTPFHCCSICAKK